MRNNILFVALGAAHAVQGALTTCNADNCLRAVRNTAMAARGSSDCASYLGTTVTASATTVTRTVTATSSPLSTSSATEIDTVSFGTVISTELDTSTITPTVTVTSITSTETSVATSVVFARRDAASSNTVPAYASPCSGAVRYSSACACNGVAGSTVTVSGPTSYTTVTATSTLATAVIVNTQTVLTTIPATSTTETDLTTVYAPTATSIVDVGASTTITSTSTSTTSQPTPTSMGPFCLIGAVSGSNYVLSNIGVSNTNIIAKGLTDTSRPTIMFTLDSAGHLVTSQGYKIYVISQFFDPQNIRPVSDAAVAASPNSYAPLYCSGAIGGTISCNAIPASRNPIYTSFFRTNAAGIMAMGSSMPASIAANPGYYSAITFTLSTTCPA